LKLESIVTIPGSRNLKSEFLNKDFAKYEINARLFDENERSGNDEMITWNDNEEVIYCIDKKKIAK
jgi:hypothetical protein